MSRFAYCVEGRHQGTKPKFSRPCPGKIGHNKCDCDCHAEKPSRFRPRGVTSKNDQSTSD